MKFLLVLFFVGTVFAEYAWTPGHEYSYDYKGRVMTGYEEIEKVISGTGFHCRVNVQVKSDHELLIQIQDPKIADVKNMEIPEGHWRKEVPLSYTPMEEEYKEFMTRPFKLYLKGGQVEFIETTSEEPSFVRNIKKGIATQFSMNMGKVRPAPLKISYKYPETMVNSINKDFYVVEEDSISGECKVHYSMVPLPEFLTERETASLPEEIRKFPMEKPTFVLIKTRDFDSCTKKPTFVHLPLPGMKHPCTSTDGTCGKFSSRTSVSYYLLTGNPEQKFDMLRSWTEGEFIYRPFGMSTESILTVSNQTMSLMKTMNIENPIPEIRAGKRQTLLFEINEENEDERPSYESPESPRYQPEDMMRTPYDKFEDTFNTISKNMKPKYPKKYFSRDNMPTSDFESRDYDQDMSPRTPMEDKYRYPMRPSSYYNRESYRFPIPRSSYPTLTGRPNLPFNEMYSESKVPFDKVKSQIKEMMMEVVDVIESFDKPTEKEPTLKLHRISHLFSTLNLDEIRSLYTEMVPNGKGNPTEKTLKHLMLDTIAMCGTNPCIMFLKEMIVKKMVSTERAAQLIMSFPVTMKTPTKEIMRELITMIPQMTPGKSSYSTLLMAITNLLNRVCVDPKTMPYYRFGKFGSPYCTQKDVDMILPILAEHVERNNDYAVRSIVIQALGNLAHPDVLRVLKPFVFGHKTTDPQMRSKAIYALTKLAKVHPNEVYAMLKPIYNNPEEHPEIRIACFSVILCTKPPKTFFTEVATQTWFEQSQHVGSFVYSTFSHLANSTNPMHTKVARICQMVLPLTKPFDMGFPFPKNIYVTKYSPLKQVGSFFHMAHSSSLKSIIPNEIYGKLIKHFGGIDIPAFEFAIHTQGVQEYMNRFFNIINKEEGLPVGLDIKPRVDFPLEGSFYFNVMGVLERYFTLENLRDFIMEEILDFSNLNNMEINYQKVVPLHERTVVMPTDLGLPVYINVRLPMLISLRGKVQTDFKPTMMNIFNKNMIPENFKLSVDFKPMISFDHIVEAGIVSPFTRKIYNAGVRRSMRMTFPGKFDLTMRNKEFEFNMMPTEGQIPQEVELFSVRCHPYVSTAEYFNPRNMEVRKLKSMPELREYRQPFGKEFFGFPMEFVGRYDHPFDTMVKPMEYFKEPISFFRGPMEFFRDPLSAFVRMRMEFIRDPKSFFHQLFSTFTPLSQCDTIKERDFRVIFHTPETETKRINAKFTYESKDSDEPIHSTNYEADFEKRYNGMNSRMDETAKKMEDFFKTPMKVFPDLHSTSGRKLFENPSSDSKDNKICSFHVEVTMEGSKTRKYRSTFISTKNFFNTDFKTTFMFEREPVADLPPFRVCYNANYKFPEMKTHNRPEMLEAPKTTIGRMELRFGPTCDDHVLSGKMIMDQTPEYSTYARESPEARECTRMESEGRIFSDMCTKARFQAANLNKMVLDLDFSKVPKEFVNRTLDFDNYIKFYFYPYMTSDRLDVQNPEDKVKIVLIANPPKSYRPYNVIDFFVYKPKENNFYKTIKPSYFFDAIFPFHANYPHKYNMMYKLSGGQSSPMCYFQKDYITTFDNVTYRYPMKDCFHLVAKDCSMEMPVQVLAKDHPNGKIVKIQINKHTVELHPEYKITIDGTEIPTPEPGMTKEITENDRPIIQVIRKTSFILVKAPYHGLKVMFDGANFKTKMSNMYRGRVCGLCGDYNGEKTFEYQTPSQCVVSDPEVFARSYALGPCSRPEKDIPECRKRMKTFVNMEPERLVSSVLTQLTVPPECTRYVHKITVDGNRRCFSVNTVPECDVGCMPSGTRTEKLGFFCMPDGEEANDLASKSVFGSVEELTKKMIHTYHQISVPTSCVRI